MIRSSGTAPAPLPYISSPELRSTAAGSVMVGPALSGALGHGPVWWSRHAEIDTRAVVKTPDAIHAGDQGERVAAAVMRTARQRLNDGMQPSRANLYNHLALARSWLGELFTAGWSPKGAHDGGMHEGCPFVTTSLYPVRREATIRRER